MDLTSYLIHAGVTKTEFAALSGLNKNTVTNLCMGRVKPSVRTLHLLGKHTGGLVRPEDFEKKDAAE